MAARRRPREFWERLLVEAERTSIAEAARRHRVSASSLKWWRWQFRRQSASPPETKLLPVVFAAGERAISGPQPISIDIDERLTFRVPVGTDEHYVAALVAAVRATC